MSPLIILGKVLSVFGISLISSSISIAMWEKRKLNRELAELKRINDRFGKVLNQEGNYVNNNK